MELWLIRHALPQRVETTDGTPADPPLTREGRAQAERLAAWLSEPAPDALYASPLRRARETAEPLAGVWKLPVAIEPGVTEFEADSSSYVPLEELRTSDPERWRAWIDAGAYPAGDVGAFRSAAVAALERIVAANRGRRVAVVCHGGVINAWASHVLGTPRLFLFEPDYTSTSRFLAASSGERSLMSLNERPRTVSR